MPIRTSPRYLCRDEWTGFWRILCIQDRNTLPRYVPAAILVLSHMLNRVLFATMSTISDVNLTASNLLGDVSYTFSYQGASFRVGDLSTRAALLCITFVVLVMWLRALTWHRIWQPGTGLGGDIGQITLEYTPARLWLPQQHLVTLFLISTVLWLNPIFVSTSLQLQTQVRFFWASDDVFYLV